MKKLFFVAIGFTSLAIACNKKALKRDYTKVTISLMSNSKDLADRKVYAYDATIWDPRWDKDSAIIDTTQSREIVLTDSKGNAVFSNVEYPDVYDTTATKLRLQSEFRFVTQYKNNDTLVQKVHRILVTKGNELQTPFNID